VFNKHKGTRNSAGDLNLLRRRIRGYGGVERIRGYEDVYLGGLR